MARAPCDGCGRSVQIAGGIANLWTLEHDETEGLTLELDDGGEFFLCYACIDRLPDDETVTTAHVEALPDHEE